MASITRLCRGLASSPAPLLLPPRRAAIRPPNTASPPIPPSPRFLRYVDNGPPAAGSKPPNWLTSTTPAPSVHLVAAVHIARGLLPGLATTSRSAMPFLYEMGKAKDAGPTRPRRGGRAFERSGQ